MTNPKPITDAEREAIFDEGQSMPSRFLTDYSALVAYEARLQQLEEALPRAFNEGFNEGCKEHETFKGGNNHWKLSKTYAALNGEPE